MVSYPIPFSKPEFGWSLVIEWGIEPHYLLVMVISVWDMRTDATGNSSVQSVGEVVVYPLLRGHMQANDITIQGTLQKGHFQKLESSSTPETVHERGDGTFGVVHDSGGE